MGLIHCVCEMSDKSDRIVHHAERCSNRERRSPRRVVAMRIARWMRSESIELKYDACRTRSMQSRTHLWQIIGKPRQRQTRIPRKICGIPDEKNKSKTNNDMKHMETDQTHTDKLRWSGFEMVKNACEDRAALWRLWQAAVRGRHSYQQHLATA